MSLAVLNSRIKKMECENKPIPQKYIDCFNDYIKKIINIRVDQEVEYLNDIIADKFELGKFKSVNELIYAYKSLEKEYTKSRQRIADLEAKLAEKEKEISNLNGLVRERDKQIKNLKTNKKRVIEHKNKNKISFTIDKLEKVKEYCYENIYSCSYKLGSLSIFDFIDNQIKQLKEAMKSE